MGHENSTPDAIFRFICILRKQAKRYKRIMTRWNGTEGAPVIYQMPAKRKKKTAFSTQGIRGKKYGSASSQGTELF